MVYKLDATKVGVFEADMEKLGKFTTLFLGVDGKRVQEGFHHCIEAVMTMASEVRELIDHVDTTVTTIHQKQEIFKNISTKLSHLISQVQGTKYEWDTYVKFGPKKLRDVRPDISNITDPDLRVWDDTDKYEKIVELKTAMSTDKSQLKDRVISQLSSAISQLCSRTLENTTAKDYKYKAAIEINSNEGESLLRANPFSTSLPTSKESYDSFFDIIQKSFLRKGVTSDDLDKLFGDAFSSENVQYEVITVGGKYRLQSSNFKGTFQIDFKFLNPIQMTHNSSTINVDKMKFFIFSNHKYKGAKVKDREVWLHKVAYLVGEQPRVRHQYDCGTSKALIHWSVS